jgi:hypothetical protein
LSPSSPLIWFVPHPISGTKRSANRSSCHLAGVPGRAPDDCGAARAIIPTLRQPIAAKRSAPFASLAMRLFSPHKSIRQPPNAPPATCRASGQAILRTPPSPATACRYRHRSRFLRQNPPPVNSLPGGNPAPLLRIVIQVSPFFRAAAAQEMGMKCTVPTRFCRICGSAILPYLRLWVPFCSNKILAVTLYKQATAAEPRNARFAYILGVALSANGDSQAAIAELRRSVELDPSVPDAYRKLSEIYDHLRQHSLSKQVLAEYLKFMPQNILLRRGF